MSERAVREWVERACAVVDGATADYIAVHVRAAPKSWPEHAAVRVESRPTADVIEEVLGHVRDVGESAAAEGRGGWAVRLKLYRAKMPAGSKTFSSAGSAPPGSDAETEPDEERSPRSEMVATIRELRQLSVHVTAELASQSTHGWQLAHKLAESNASLVARNAQLEAAVKLGAQSESDPLRDGLAQLLPQLPMILGTLAQVAASRQVMARDPGDG